MSSELNQKIKDWKKEKEQKSPRLTPISKRKSPSRVATPSMQRQSQPSIIHETQSSIDPNQAKWAQFVYKGNKVNIERLILVAKTMANDPEADPEHLQQINNELEQQIQTIRCYKSNANQELKDGEAACEELEKNISRLEIKKKLLRQRYLEIYNDNVNFEKCHKSDSIGDSSDYQFALDLLTIETQKLKEEIEYLQDIVEYSDNPEEESDGEDSNEMKTLLSALTQNTTEIDVLEEEEEIGIDLTEIKISEDEE